MSGKELKDCTIRMEVFFDVRGMEDTSEENLYEQFDKMFDEVVYNFNGKSDGYWQITDAFMDIEEMRDHVPEKF